MEELSPQQQISRMLTGYWISQALYVAAKLGLADFLKDGPRTAANLALATQSHPGALYRLLRALASMRVFAEDDRHRFSLTPLADCLRSDVPGSQRPLAIMAGEEHYHAFGQLLYSVQTGKIAFDKLYGMPVFDFLQKHPEQAKIFDEAMIGVHGRETASMLDAYDFSGIRVLADIGGGNGSVLTAVLRKYPAMRGILFDLPGVVERAKANIQAADLWERCQVIGGTFFDSVPSGADAYLLRHIIHDWDDEQSTRILKNIHRAMGKEGRVLVVESVIPPGNDPAFGKLLDLAMLVIPGGEERTQEEYQKLYEAAGFRLTRIVPTEAEVSVIEGRWE
jgi:ubiquinone/menaquinone biosynthesis C-methylase UbiE